MKKSPGASCRAGVLTSHEKGNHDVGNLVILQLLAVAVALLEEGSNHVMVELKSEDEFS